jgi:hypothetical protein
MWHMWQLWRAVNRVQKVPCLVRGCFCYHYSIEGVGDYCWGWAFWLPPVWGQQCTYYRHYYGNGSFYCTHPFKIPPPPPVSSFEPSLFSVSVYTHQHNCSPHLYRHSSCEFNSWKPSLKVWQARIAVNWHLEVVQRKSGISTWIKRGLQGPVCLKRNMILFSKSLEFALWIIVYEGRYMSLVQSHCFLSNHIVS